MIEKFTTMALMLSAGPRERKDERGATATEYALLVGLIALAIAGLVLAFGGVLGGFFDTLGDRVGDWANGTDGGGGTT
jgi:pilus assembly protein Flp/PilA